VVFLVVVVATPRRRRLFLSAELREEYEFRTELGISRKLGNFGRSCGRLVSSASSTTGRSEQTLSRGNLPGLQTKLKLKLTSGL
jgi:hypothetical protein